MHIPADTYAPLALAADVAALLASLVAVPKTPQAAVAVH